MCVFMSMHLQSVLDMQAPAGREEGSQHHIPTRSPRKGVWTAAISHLAVECTLVYRASVVLNGLSVLRRVCMLLCVRVQYQRTRLRREADGGRSVLSKELSMAAAVSGLTAAHSSKGEVICARVCVCVCVCVCVSYITSAHCVCACAAI